MNHSYPSCCWYPLHQIALQKGKSEKRIGFVLTNFNRQILTVLPQYSAFKVLCSLLSTRDIIPWLRAEMQPLTKKSRKKRIFGFKRGVLNLLRVPEMLAT